MTFHECCEAVLNGCKNPYAQAYAKAGLGLTEAEAVRVQALYIIGNLTAWRGETAKAVRSELKRYSKR